MVRCVRRAGRGLLLVLSPIELGLMYDTFHPFGFRSFYWCMVLVAASGILFLNKITWQYITPVKPKPADDAPPPPAGAGEDPKGKHRHIEEEKALTATIAIAAGGPAPSSAAVVTILQDSSLDSGGSSLTLRKRTFHSDDEMEGSNTGGVAPAGTTPATTRAAGRARNQPDNTGADDGGGADGGG